MPDNKDKEFWKTVIKLVLGALALIIFFGGGLYFTAMFNTYAPPSESSAPDWGISKDSPIPSRR